MSFNLLLNFHIHFHIVEILRLQSQYHKLKLQLLNGYLKYC